MILDGSSKVGKAKVYKTRKEMRLTKELTQERERRESAEGILKHLRGFIKRCEMEEDNPWFQFAILTREHFKKWGASGL